MPQDSGLTQLPPGLDPETNQIINGKLYTIQHGTTNQDNFDYMGPASGFNSREEAAAADQQEGGSWVPASTTNPNGTLFGPKWMLPAMLAGPAIADAVGGLFAGGVGAGEATPAAVQAAAASPEAAGAAGTAGVAAPVVTGSAGSALAGAPVTTLGTVGPSTMASPFAAASFGADPAAAGAGGGILSTIGKIIKKAAPILKGAGAGVGAATTAAANNRSELDDFNLKKAALELQNSQLGLQGFNANTAAQSALENELMARAVQEAAQRKTDLSNVYKSSVAHNLTSSPYNPRPQTPSQAFLDTLSNLEQQGKDELSKGPTYNAATLPAPQRTTYTQPVFTPPTPTKKGTLEDIGDWLGPILTTVGGFA